MEQTDYTHKIINFLEGNLSNDEQAELAKWINDCEANARFYVETKDTWEASLANGDEIANTTQEWEKFKSLVKSSSAGVQSGLKKTLVIWQSVAAVLVVTVAILSVLVSLNYFVSGNNEVLTVQTIVPTGEKSQILLPDGTKVWINSASVLSYNTGYGKQNRDVEIDGEAFFEVAHNAEIPFNVHTKDCEIKVLGTKFNVRSYDTNTQTETALLEGKVEVTLLKGKQVNLIPGQLAVADNENNELKIVQRNVTNSICWKDNVLRFDNTPLSEVVDKLGYWYGVNFHLSNAQNLEEKHFTFTVKTESLKELLDIVKLVQPLNYQIKGEDIYIEIIQK